MKNRLVLLAAIVATGFTTTSPARADEDHAYTFGPVVVVSFVRTQPGMFEEYLRYLDNTYKKVLDEYEKQGIILDYAVYLSRPRDPQDPDVVLSVKYKNMAAFDDLQSRTDPIVKQVFGSLPKAASASADRDRLRKERGSQQLRQLILK